MKQKLSQCQAHWALYLSQFKFIIIHKLGAYNKSDALSCRPDHKEGMVHDNQEQVLLDMKYFSTHAVRPTAVTSQGDKSLRECLKQAQMYDTEVSQALESVLKNSPRSFTKGLEDWNYEDGIILFRGHIYVPKDLPLQRDIVKSYHNYVAIGHPGCWKTYKLVSQEYWWPGMSTFVCEYVDGCAICQSTKNHLRMCIPLRPNEIPTDIWGIIMDLPLSKGYNSLLVVVNRLSKATVLAPCNKTITVTN